MPVTSGPTRRTAYRAGKRALDIVVAVALIALLWPLLAALWLAVRVSSPGPAIFRQARAGCDGRVFVMWKFRSMHASTGDGLHRAYVTALLTSADPPDGGEAGVFKLTADPRVTRVGRVLRRTSLDELPQLFNVLRGDMSLVGPRPCLPWEVGLFEPRHRRRLEVPPGLTGLWQVSGRSRLTMRQALDLDVEYVERCGWALDLAILLRTPAALLRRSGAR